MLTALEKTGIVQLHFYRIICPRPGSNKLETEDSST